MTNRLLGVFNYGRYNKLKFRLRILTAKLGKYANPKPLLVFQGKKWTLMHYRKVELVKERHHQPHRHKLATKICGRMF